MAELKRKHQWHIEDPVVGDIPRCTPNLLPCLVHHDGPVDASRRYWEPRVDGDGSQTSYFRGRKLKGKAVPVPGNYQGALLSLTDRGLPKQSPSQPQGHDEEQEAVDDEDEDESDATTTLVMEQVATFDEFVVWQHDVMPDEAENQHMQSVEEWIKLAEAIHSPDDTKPGLP